MRPILPKLPIFDYIDGLNDVVDHHNVQAFSIILDSRTCGLYRESKFLKFNERSNY